MKEKLQKIDGIVGRKSANNKAKKRSQNRWAWVLVWARKVDEVIVGFGDLTEDLLMELNAAYERLSTGFDRFDWKGWLGLRYVRDSLEKIGDSSLEMNIPDALKPQIDGHNLYWKYKNIFFVALVIFISTILSLGSWVVLSEVMSIKDGVVVAAGEGMVNVRGGIDLMKGENFYEAAEYFDHAIEDFEGIKSQIERTGHSDLFLGQSVVKSEVEEVTNMIDGVVSMTRGAKFLALSMNEIKTIDENESFSGLFFGMILGQGEKEEFFVQLKRAGEYLSISSVELEDAALKLNNIDASLLPEEFRSVYMDGMADVPRYLSILRGVNVLVSDSGVFLGENVPAKYLLIFQNTNEVRPTGGFIGSYGIMTMSEGKMQELVFDDVYNPDGQLVDEIVPPYPIWLMSDQWGMRDSNWSPDFPTAADQAVRMFEKGGGYSVDGVVAFTPKIVEKFLGLIGPIEMSEYQVTLTEENFVDEVQREIEIDRDMDEGKPKQILADLLPILMDKLGDLDEEKKKDLWQVMLDLLSEKDVMLFLYDEEVENVLKEVGWAGEVVQTEENEDYLYMVHANIGGRKSDAFIKETVRHTVNVESNGDIVVDLEIVRKNIDDWTWPNYPNYDYLRVYVPKGSELLEVDGFVDSEGVGIDEEEGVIGFDENFGEAGLSSTRMYEENGKQVFANWVVTEPYEASKVKYKYRLPYKYNSWLSDEYKLYVQHQPGRDNVDYKFIFDSQVQDIYSTNMGTINQNGEVEGVDDMRHDIEVEIGF